MRGEYTEEIHAKRLIKMLERKNSCMCCPAQPRYEANSCKSPGAFFYKSKKHPCTICEGFISTFGCPCYTLGEEKAITKTIQVLKKKGYL